MGRLERIIKKNDYVYILSLKAFTLFKIVKSNYYKTFSDEKRRNYIKRRYKKFTNQELKWDNLIRYTEKMQWYKLYCSTQEKTICADKYTVRKWIKDRLGNEDILIPLIGVWDDPRDIDFENLPNQFVLKVSSGSGGNIIIKNKEESNYKVCIERLKSWQKVNYAYLNGFEMQYDGAKSVILCEEYIESGDEDLIDYKFLCFDGTPYYCWVDIGRYHNHSRKVYDMNWNLQEWNQFNYKQNNTPVERPSNFDEMVKLVEKLAAGFSHVRVDLYNVNGQIYFGEMTFTNGSGFELIYPDEYNIMLGELWKM